MERKNTPDQCSRTSDLPAGIGAPEAGENGFVAFKTVQEPPRTDSMNSVWSPFNPSYTLRWVCDRHYCPCYTHHGGPVRTWGPDFLLKLSNVRADFQFKKICHGGSMNECLKDRQSCHRHTDNPRGHRLWQDPPRFGIDGKCASGATTFWSHIVQNVCVFSKTNISVDDFRFAHISLSDLRWSEPLK